MVSENKRIMNNRRRSLDLIDGMRPLRIGSIKISKANTDAHELMKYLICRQLCKEGKQFITECYFNNGKRADIVVLDDIKVIEVLCTESEKSCMDKVLDYPREFEVIMVFANQDWNNKLIY